jgi:uncharacterized protein YbjT (DUF2867 family)
MTFTGGILIDSLLSHDATRKGAPMTEQSKILVTGATGTVGREVAYGLLEADADVRAMTRNPDSAALPESVEVVHGDLADVPGLEERVRGAEAVFLVWPFLTDDEAESVVDTIARHARRIVYLSAEAASERPDSFWAAVERHIEHSGLEWMFLRPTGFAANTLMWADQIRDSGVVRFPYGEAKRSLIHERDIAEVAVRALTEDGHASARYVLTGPQAITQVEQAHAIGEALGQPVRWEELSREDAREQLAEQLGGIPEGALDTWAAFVEKPEIVTSTVEELTGEPARTFGQWARDHAEDFR